MVYDPKAVEINIERHTVSESRLHVALHTCATTESLRITGCENTREKVLCRDLNTNLNKQIQARGKHLDYNVLSDKNRWKILCWTLDR